MGLSFVFVWFVVRSPAVQFTREKKTKTESLPTGH